MKLSFFTFPAWTGFMDFILNVCMKLISKQPLLSSPEKLFYKIIVILWLMHHLWLVTSSVLRWKIFQNSLIFFSNFYGHSLHRRWTISISFCDLSLCGIRYLLFSKGSSLNGRTSDYRKSERKLSRKIDYLIGTTVAWFWNGSITWTKWLTVSWIQFIVLQ